MTLHPRIVVGGLVLALLSFASGCASLTGHLAMLFEMQQARHDLREDLREERQDVKEELHRLLLEEKLALQEQRLAEERGRVAQMRQCLPETAPLVESTLALPIQQQFIVGQPEVDLNELRERMKLEESDFPARMDDWRRAMADWRDRKALHDKADANRRAAALHDFNNNQCQKQCGCQAALKAGRCCCPAHQQGECGCEQALKCGKCCCKHHHQPCEEITCEYAPLKEQPFTEQPPTMPVQSLPIAELPIKVRLQVREEIGRARITELRARQAPIHEAPICNKEGCVGPDGCTEKPRSAYYPRGNQGSTPAGIPPSPMPDDREAVTPRRTEERLPPVIPALPASLQGWLEPGRMPSGPFARNLPDAGDSWSDHGRIQSTLSAPAFSAPAEPAMPRPNTTAGISG